MGLLLAMLCGMGIFSLIQMSRINAASTEIADNWLPSTRYAQGLNVCLQLPHSGNHAHLLHQQGADGKI